MTRSLAGPEILTPRLKLSRLSREDASALFAYRARPEVCRFQGFEPGTLADAEAFIARTLAHPFDTPGTWYQFGIRLRDTGELVGDIGAHFLAEDPRQVEIGFTVAPEHQGQGVASEAATTLIDHLLGPGGKHRVLASVDPRNEGSVRLLQRLGLRREAHFRQSLFFKGKWVDDLVFAVLADEWEEKRRTSSPNLKPE